MKIHSFEPLVWNDPKILILGSMPGAESLRQQKYYAHKRNVFWRIIADLLNGQYPQRYEFDTMRMIERRIALWDVLKHCEREGSLDHNIKNEHPNDFEAFFEIHSTIEVIFFNGQKAANSYEKHVGLNRVDTKYITLPSTSPALAVSYESKLEHWSVLKDYL